jgi:serine/threonine-protein kinase
MTADARDLFDRGHAALTAGDALEAVECFGRAIALRPDVAAAYRARARAYLALDRRREALDHLGHAIRLRPDDPATYAERAEVLFRQKAYDAAIADCDKVLSLDAGWAAILGLRAECHAAAGATGQALADFAAALDGDPVHAPRYLLARARLQLDHEDYAGCVADCTAALRHEPENALVLRTRGLAYRELRELDAAETDLSESLRLEPEAPLTRLARASVRADRGEFAAAAADCDEIIRLAPRMVSAYTLRSICRKQRGDLTGAIADFTEAARLMPQSAEPYVLRAGLHEQQGEYVEAIRDYLEALKRSPRDATIFNQLGWLWATAPDAAVRNGERAKECATRACELTDWQNDAPLDTLAAACAECGEFAAAIRWEEQALGLDGRDEYAARLELYRQGKPYRAPGGGGEAV